MKKFLVLAFAAVCFTVGTPLFAGEIFLTEYKSDAKAIVYFTEYQSDADLVVYVTDYKSDADMVVYPTKYKSDANLIVYVTKYKSDAAWKKSNSFRGRLK